VLLACCYEFLLAHLPQTFASFHFLAQIVHRVLQPHFAPLQKAVQLIPPHSQQSRELVFRQPVRGAWGPVAALGLDVLPRWYQSVWFRLLAGAGVAKDVVVVSSEEADAYRYAPGTIIKPALLEGKILYERRA